MAVAFTIESGAVPVGALETVIFFGARAAVLLVGTVAAVVVRVADEVYRDAPSSGALELAVFRITDTTLFIRAVPTIIIPVALESGWEAVAVGTMEGIRRARWAGTRRGLWSFHWWSRALNEKESNTESG
jgi:hypothetical protein